MSALAADLLGAWLVVTAVCSVLLVLVVAVQDALARARAFRRRSVDGRTRGRVTATRWH